MDREEIFGQLTEVFRDIFDDDSIELTDETTAADIEEWNSFTHITLISDIEDAFGIRFEMKDVVGLKNVGEMADLIEKLSIS
ncbi:MAG: acyl carrier protein [Lachnospiraceae bacterium]|nr:acyl carrier protein [Lachnospiraceae bacterium]